MDRPFIPLNTWSVVFLESQDLKITKSLDDNTDLEAQPKNSGKSHRPTVSIVIPVLNEIEILPSFWEKLYTVISVTHGKTEYSTSAPINEVIFVDGGSTDDTLRFLEDLSSKFKNETFQCSIKIVSQPVGTKLAYAEFLGINTASGDLIIKMDGDLQHDPFFIPEMIENSAENDIVIASRYIRNGGNNWSPMRGIISRFARLETHFLLPGTRRVGDPLSGFFLIHKNILNQVHPHKDGYKLLTHILALVSGSTRVKELPFIMTERNKGSSKIIKSVRKTVMDFNRELIFARKASILFSKSMEKMGQEDSKLLIVSRASFKNGEEGGADRYAISLAKEIQRITKGQIELYFVGRKNGNLQQTVTGLIEVQNKRNIESTNPLKYFFKGFLLNVSSAITGINFIQSNKDIKLVNTNSNIATILIKFATLGRKVKLIYTIHDNLYSSREKMRWWEIPIRLINNFILERIAIRISSNIIVVSPVISNQIPIKHKYKVDMIFPQGNLPSEEPKSNFNQECMNNHFLLPTKYALVACYLDDRKRVDIILRSWKFVAEEVSLIVVGDGPNYNKLKLISDLMGLSGRVLFTGRITDNQLSYLIRKSLFGVVASNREGFPTFIIECLKSGTPSIFFISSGVNIYEEVAGSYLDVKKLVDPWQMSIDINRFITRIYHLNREKTKEWGLSKFGLNDDLIKTLFTKQLNNDESPNVSQTGDYNYE